MYVLTENNNYLFSNTVVTVTDNTTVVPTVPARGARPRHNMLYVTMLKEGPVNRLSHYYTGEEVLYTNAHGLPSYVANGVASESIYNVLSSNSGIGVYVMNLADTNNKLANVVLSAMTRLEVGVQVTDVDGNPLYITPDGRIVTEAAGNEPYLKDVLHVKYVAESMVDLTDNVDNFYKLNALYTGVADAEGFIKYPLMSFYYDGRGSFGNTVKLSFDTIVSEYSTNTYYRLKVVDERKGTTYAANMSFLPDAAEFFVPNVVNASVTNIMSQQSDHIETFFAQVSQYVSSPLSTLDLFSLSGELIVMEADSLDIGADGALTFVNGVEDAAVTFDELAIKFFNEEIVDDIIDIIRYRINYIPDMGYSDPVKMAIKDFTNKRIRTTVASLAAGSEFNFGSAVTDSKENYLGDSQQIRLLANCQRGLMTSPFTKKQHVYPPGYYDTVTFTNRYLLNGVPYFPFAGADVRWSGFVDESVQFPGTSITLANELTGARVNVVKKDANAGAYLTDQYMCTDNISDLTELSNVLMLSDMIYDVVDLVHINNFKFNELEEVAIFQEKVDTDINTRYAAYSASLAVDVYREGTTGLEGRTNIIEVSVDFKDISKYAKVEFIINDN